MSLPVTEALVAASNVYTWEPPNRVIAARYGLAPGDVLRFDTNTSPTGPAFLAEPAAGTLRSRAQRVPRFHLRGAGRGGRRVRRRRPLRDPRRLRRRRGARHHRQDVPGARAWLARAHADLRHVRRARLAAWRPPAGGAAARRQRRLRHRPARRPRAAAGGRRGLALRSQQPDRGTRVRGDDRGHPGRRRPAPGGGPAIVVDEAYIEFRPGSLAAGAPATRSSSSCAPSPRPSPCPACAWATRSRPVPPSRAWSASGRPAASPRSRPRSQRRRCGAPSWPPPMPPCWAPSATGWPGSWRPCPCRPTRASRTSCSCASATHGAAEAAEEHLLRRGIVPRTFGPGHPLRGHLRFTVRDRAQDERLVAALAAWMDGRTA